MQFNPLTGMLWDDEGRFLKSVYCPKGATRADIAAGICRLCDHAILTLDDMPEVKVLSRLRADPSLCLSFRPDHPAMGLIHHDPT